MIHHRSARAAGGIDAGLPPGGVTQPAWRVGVAPQTRRRRARHPTVRSRRDRRSREMPQRRRVRRRGGGCPQLPARGDDLGVAHQHRAHVAVLGAGASGDARRAPSESAATESTATSTAACIQRRAGVPGSAPLDGHRAHAVVRRDCGDRRTGRRRSPRPRRCRGRSWASSSNISACRHRRHQRMVSAIAAPVSAAKASQAASASAYSSRPARRPCMPATAPPSPPGAVGTDRRRHPGSRGCPRRQPGAPDAIVIPAAGNVPAWRWACTKPHQCLERAGVLQLLEREPYVGVQLATAPPTSACSWPPAPRVGADGGDRANQAGDPFGGGLESA